MPPVIKIYKVPTVNFTGVNNPVDETYQVVDSVTNPDIRWFLDEEILPINQGRDDVNLPPASEAPNEPDHAYKVKLTLVSGDVYRVDAANAAAGKKWVTNHKYIGFLPEIFIQYQHKYLDEIWSYTYVPLYSVDRVPYYTLFTSGSETRIQFSATFLTDLADGKILQTTLGEPVPVSDHTQLVFAASFYYWLAAGTVSPVNKYMAASGDYCEMSNVLIKKSTNGGGSWVSIQGAGVNPPDVEGSPFHKDAGYFEYSGFTAGTLLRISGYRHTWERLLNTDLADLSFFPGENSQGSTSSNTSLARDLTPQYPWYNYVDLKIVNESPDILLDKFCLHPVLRGTLDANGNPLTGFQNLSDPFRPWDVQEGGDLETCGFDGPFTTGAAKEVCCVMAWEAGNNTPVYPNFCAPSGIPDAVWLGQQYSYGQKFPAGCRTKLGKSPGDITANPEFYNGLENTVNYFIGTRTDPGGDVCFVRSTEMERTAQNLWKQKDASQNPNRMVIPEGTISIMGPAGSTESMPNPGAVFCRVIWTYRNFNELGGDFNNDFTSVNETRGGKAWSLRIRGKYYE